jgi:hypothetical protein
MPRVATLSAVARRRLVGAAIVLFWAATIGVLVMRELRSRTVPAPRPAAPAAAATDTWLGIYMAGSRPVGTLHLTTRPEHRQGASGVTLRLDGRLRVRMLDVPAELELEGWLWRAASEPRAEFEARVASLGHTIRVVGRIVEDELRARVFSGGEAILVRVPVARSLLGTDALLLRLPAAALAIGRETTIDAFDPLSGRPSQLHITCVREETIVQSGQSVHTRVLAVASGHATLTAWLDDDGGVVQAETPFGLALRRITHEEALAVRSASQGPELLTALRILPRGVRPVRGAQRMVVHLEGLPAGRALPTDSTQRLDADGRTLVISKASPPQTALPIPAETQRSALACDVLVQCDHPAIRAQAAEIVAGERDAWRRAVLIERWVHDNLAKRPVLSLPSALDVLKRREGDCTEHTVLYTALARAAGIPTRQVVGLVWSETLQGFGYHAWPEVFAGRWLWVDPTFGQEVADATHIRLHSGAVQSWEEAFASLGRLQVQVVEVR